MVAAYLLIKIEGGTSTAGTTLEHVRRRPEVKSIEWILGPYDCVVRCEVESIEALGALARQVRSCPGVDESTTCLVVNG